jgi:hypothetical protein
MMRQYSRVTDTATSSLVPHKFDSAGMNACGNGSRRSTWGENSLLSILKDLKRSLSSVSFFKPNLKGGRTGSGENPVAGLCPPRTFSRCSIIDA